MRGEVEVGAGSGEEGFGEFVLFVEVRKGKVSLFSCLASDRTFMMRLVGQVAKCRAKRRGV